MMDNRRVLISRSGFALALIYLFPVLIIALVVGTIMFIASGVLYLGDGEFSWEILLASSPWILGLSAVVLFPVALGVSSALWQIRSLRDQTFDGPELLRGEHSHLWGEVDALAGLVQTWSPDRIVLVPDVNAAVHQVGPIREMLIGLPLLAGLSVSQLRAVLAHEMGHFAGGDTALLSRVYKKMAFVKAVREQMGGQLRWVFQLYYYFTEIASGASRRALELGADRSSAVAAGGDVAGAALRKLATIDVAWEHVKLERLNLFAEAGVRAPAYQALAESLRDKGISFSDQAYFALQEERALWEDSHPRTLDRIATLRALPPAETVDERPAWELLTGGGARLAELEGGLWRQEWPLTSWADVVDRATKRRLSETLDDAIYKLHAAGLIDARTPQALLDVIVSDPVSLGTWAAGQDWDPDGVAQHYVWVVRSLIEGSLARVPDIHVVELGSGGLELRDRTGSLIVITDLAADPIALQGRLLDLGANLAQPVPDEYQPPPSPPVVLGVLTRLLLAEAPYQVTCLVCTEGLLLVPFQERVIDWALGGASVANQIADAEQLVNRAYELRCDPACRWIPATDIVYGKETAFRSTFEFLLIDESELRLKTDRDSRQFPVRAPMPLPALLGDRFKAGNFTLYSRKLGRR